MTWTRADAARHAAKLIYVDVKKSARDKSPEKYEGQREFLTRLDIEGRIADAMRREYEDAIELMIDEGVHEYKMVSLTGIDPREETEAEKLKLERLKDACEKAIAQINTVLGHACEWNEDDYCVVCGVDGRA